MAKREAERCKKIMVWWLLKNIHKTNGFRSSTVGWGEQESISVLVNVVDPNSYIQFKYSLTDNQAENSRNFDYKVQLISTPCKFGGKRFWYICPLIKNDIPCRKRVGVLYMNGDYFGCRECCELTYKSRNRSRDNEFSYFSEVFDVGDELEKINNKRHNLTYKGKPTKTGKKMEKLYKRKFMAYRGFELQEKGLSKGRLELKKVV